MMSPIAVTTPTGTRTRQSSSSSSSFYPSTPRIVHCCRVALSAGVLVSFSTSLLLVRWHERAMMTTLSATTEAGAGAGGSRQRARKKRGRESIPLSSSLSWPPVLTAFVEPRNSYYDEFYHDPSRKDVMPIRPLPNRTVRSSQLTVVRFPELTYGDGERGGGASSICGSVPALLPIDNFAIAVADPYLPWIHDVFASADGSNVRFVAQNRRRCHKGKNHLEDMSFWEGQVALFQPVAVKRLGGGSNATRKGGAGWRRRGSRSGNVRYRLSSHAEADADAVESRFICRFKSIDYRGQSLSIEGETLSTYPFNYEFVSWRKNKGKNMVEDKKDMTAFWLSQLMFNCPVPDHLRSSLSRSSGGSRGGGIGDKGGNPSVLVDVVPIRTPARRNDRDGFFFHAGHGGPRTFDADTWWGQGHVLPNVEDSGRWENVPVCPVEVPFVAPSVKEVDGGPVEVEATVGDVLDVAADGSPENGIAKEDEKKRPRRHRLVACTWTSALHQRRGNERRIADGKFRLREWIAFHLLAGFDHLYVFDNTNANATIFRLKGEKNPDSDRGTGNGNGEGDEQQNDLSSVTDLFPSTRVTRINWPATICNNNRPAHNDPGERSSQYAAEASCLLRYGPDADWMVSMDPDEYFVPMGNYTSWKDILDKVDRNEGLKVLKFRSTRARPLLSTLEPTYDETTKECTREQGKTRNRCLKKREEANYLETYNCEYIRSPKPERFARAMKQMYRPDYVKMHFVHYSTVNTNLATEKQHTKGRFVQDATNNASLERFTDEINEGVLIHTKTTVPAETFSRDEMCILNGESACLVGIVCPDDVPFNDAMHQKNIFHDKNGEYCNCWTNKKVKNYWLPKLKKSLREIGPVPN